MGVRRSGWALLIALWACAAPPPDPAPGRAALFGELRLVPRPGVVLAPSPESYGDRRLRDAERVDYSSPGFSVVYLDGAGPPPGGIARLVAEEGATGVRLGPRYAVVGLGSEIVVANRTARELLISIPDAGRLERLAAGAALRVPAERPGPLALFLIGAREEAVVLAVPGPWVVPDPSGRFVLGDLPPGAATLHAWHPRFPPWSAPVALAPDTAQRVEIEIGVGLEKSGRVAP